MSFCTLDALVCTGEVLPVQAEQSLLAAQGTCTCSTLWTETEWNISGL